MGNRDEPMENTHSEQFLRVKVDKPFHLSQIDPASTPGLNPHSKKETKKVLKSLHKDLMKLQRRLWAEHSRSLLLVLQALDAGGKDGTIRRVFKGVNPQGVKVAGFRQPTPEELSHDYLWRIHKALPTKGEIGIFNRSHYEDVVATYVLNLIDDNERHQRFSEIRQFEDYLDRNDIEVIKVFLHISKSEQKKRFQQRVTDPEKQWKFSESDMATREKWDEFQDAYSEAINATTTDESPWFVIPANHRWARDYAIMKLLLDRLQMMNPQYPAVPEIQGTKIR